MLSPSFQNRFIARSLIAFACVLPAFASPARSDFALPQTSVNASGGVTLDPTSSYEAQTVAGVTKLFGHGALTSDGTAGQIKFDADGSVTASAGERFRVSYDITLNLTGGTASYKVGGTFTQPLPFPLPPVILSASDDGSLTGPQTRQFTGSFETPAIPIDINGTYTTTLTIDWTGTVAGDTLSVTIPQNSIDLQVVPVPEPGMLGIATGYAACALLRRRR